MIKNKKIYIIVILTLLLLSTSPILFYNQLNVKAQTQTKIFILTSDFGDYVNDVVAKLSTFPGLSIDVYNLQYGPLPTLSQLMTYDAGLVWANYALGSAPGDLISDYVDAGGGVVIMWAADFDGWALGGRYASTGKNLLPQDVYGYGETAALGEIVIPGHPIMQGVTKFTNYNYYMRALYTVNGGIIVAKYTTGDVLVAVSPSGKVASLNFFPPSTDANSGSWAKSTDGALLMYNALLFVAGKTIYQSQKVGVSASGSSETGKVTVKASLSGVKAGGGVSLRLSDGSSISISLKQVLYYNGLTAKLSGMVTRPSGILWQIAYITLSVDGNIIVEIGENTYHFYGTVRFRDT
ncbi:MAG: hypothetical protein QXV52_05365 [Nitrososphaeria archaeon]